MTTTTHWCPVDVQSLQRFLMGDANSSALPIAAWTVLWQDSASKYCSISQSKGHGVTFPANV
jgi:hypothetical protein